MKTFKHLRLVVLFFGLVLGLSACRVDVSSIETATVKTMVNGVPEGAWTLSDDQVAKLNVWLGKNRGGWDETRTQYVPNLLVNLKHKDGQSSTLGITRNFVVLSFKGELHVQKFDQDDIVSLQAILGSR